jgi:nucleoside-diphosphate-sugar epimerase
MSVRQDRFITEDFDRIHPQAGRLVEGLRDSVLLVTGGAGFVGSWICELVHYLNKVDQAGITLHVVDRDRERFERQLPHLARDERIHFIRCDVRSLLEIPREVNYVIHAAGTPDNRFHASCPVETMTSIAEGTASVLRAAHRVSNLVKFVNLSSSAIYATNPDVERIAESAPGLALGLGPSSAYAEAKRYAEVLCAAARSEAKIPVVTVRPFTFCGAYQELEAPWVLNNFINDALHQRPIRILGDGKSVRSLMYGADLAYWLLAILFHGTSGQVFNAGSDRGDAVLELAQRVASHFSPAPAIQTHTSLVRLQENSRLVPDISAATTRLGLQVYTPLDQAIARTIDWYRAQHSTNGT